MSIGAALIALTVATLEAHPGVPGGAAAEGQPRLPLEMVGTAVDRLQVTDLRGTIWTPERLRGRVILIDFWATWCAPCLSELPRLKELRDRYGRDEFEILGVMLDAASKRTIVSWLNRHRIDWPQVHERAGYNGAVPAAFGVQQLPATVLLDQSGNVAAIGLRGEALGERVEQLVHSRMGS